MAHNLQMALKEIVCNKNLHLNVVPLEAQWPHSCNNCKTFLTISTVIFQAIGGLPVWLCHTSEAVCIPIQVSSSYCAIDSPLSHLNIGLFEGNCRTEEPAKCEWNERNFCSSFSGAEYIIYAFSLSTWCFDMKLLKVLRSESMERPGLKISKTLTFSELCITTRWLQHGKDQSLEVHKWKSQILCMPRKKLHRTRHIARSSSLFNTIAAFYTQCKGEPLTGHWCVMAALQMETFYTS